MVYYIRSDHIGRPVFATNAAGVQVWTASYLPFGGGARIHQHPITLRFPPLMHLADALPGNGPMVPILPRLAPELDAGFGWEANWRWDQEFLTKILFLLTNA